MSVDEVERTIPLGPQQLFSHSTMIRPEIERLRDGFERNQRFKEFDGLIRANHRIYEALETQIAPDPAKLSALTAQMDQLTNRMGEISRPHFRKEELASMVLSNAVEMVKVAEEKQREMERRRGRKDGGQGGDGITQSLLILPPVEEGGEQ